MKAGGSKLNILKKLTKKADAILDWDNKKANPSIIKRIIGAANLIEYGWIKLKEN